MSEILATALPSPALESPLSEGADDQLKKQVFHSIRWSYVGTLLPQLVRPAFTIVLARFLQAADYGIFALANGLIEFAEKTQEGGLSAAIVKVREEDLEKACNVAFILQCIVGLVVGGIIFFGAHSIAVLFNEPRVGPVLQWLSVALVLYSLSAVQVALLRRQFRFRSLAWISIAVGILPMVAAIVLAILGYGYWALVGSTLVLSVLWITVAWSMSSWRPRLEYDGRIAIQLLVFAMYAAAETMAPVLMKLADSLILGIVLGASDLGMFTFAMTIAMVSVTFLIQPLQTVAYSALCRLQDSPEKLGNAFMEGTNMVSAISIPTCIGLCITAPFIVPVVFGDRWTDASPLIAVLALMPGLSYTLALTPSAFRAIGRPDLIPKITLASLVVAIPVNLITAHYGLMAFVIGKAAIGTLVLLATVVAAVQVMRLPANFYWRAIKTPVLAALMMSILTYPACAMLTGSQPSLVESIGACVGLCAGGAAVYIVAMMALDRLLVVKFASLGRRVVGLSAT